MNVSVTSMELFALSAAVLANFYSQKYAFFKKKVGMMQRPLPVDV